MKKIDSRERHFWRKFAAASKAHEEASNLFEYADVLERRRVHLTFVIRRLARKLGIEEPNNLDALGQDELENIRVSLSKRVARSKMAQPAEEIAASPQINRARDAVAWTFAVAPESYELAEQT